MQKKIDVTISLFYEVRDDGNYLEVKEKSGYSQVV